MANWIFERPYSEDDNYSAIKYNGQVICLFPEPHYMPDTGDRTWYNGQVKQMKSNAKRICECVNACIPFENPEQDIPKLVAHFESLIFRMCAVCQVHNPQHAPCPESGYDGCKSCEEIEIYRKALALYRKDG